MHNKMKFGDHRDAFRGNAQHPRRGMELEPSAHALFIGSYSCTRHSARGRMALQREGRLSFLCLQEIDWITGSYLQQIEAAAREIFDACAPAKLVLLGGCQLELLGTDLDALAKALSSELRLPVIFEKGCSLIEKENAGGRREWM